MTLHKHSLFAASVLASSLSKLKKFLRKKRKDSLIVR